MRRMGGIQTEATVIPGQPVKGRSVTAPLCLPPVPCPPAGQLGDVMKESATIAHTYARKFLEGLPPEQLPGGSPGASFFADHAIHLHVPAGEIFACWFANKFAS